MTLEEYRVKLGWSKSRLARESGVDMGTISEVISGKRRIYKITASKIARAVSQGLGHEVSYTDFDGLQLAD